MKDLLYKKFKAVPTRPGRGGTYSYIKWQDVADRMNQIFGIRWDSEVVHQEVIGSNVVIRVRVTILDADSGDMFFQEGFGGASMDDRQEAGNPFKAAYSKALKDACKKWGVGLYIDDDDDSNSTESIKVSTNVPIKSFDAAVVNKQSQIIPPVTGKVVTDTITIKQYENPISNSPKEVTNTVVPPIPPTPVVKTDGPNGVIGDQASISDVQRAALQSILNIQGVKYDELVKDAFVSKDVVLSDSGVPTIDNLLYKEAVIVIKYGNDKFRKY